MRFQSFRNVVGRRLAFTSNSHKLLAGGSRRFSKRKCLFLVIIVNLIFVFFFSTSFNVCSPIHPDPNITNRDADYSLFSNYLSIPNETIFMNDTIVNTNKCRIPNVDIWNHQVLPYVSTNKFYLCQNKQRSGVINGLTFVDKQQLVLNKTLLESMGLKLNDIVCCYRTVERAQQDINDYNDTADETFRYSEQCHPITAFRTTPQSGFINVTCELKGYFWSTPFHTDAHLLATFEPALSSKSSILRKKIDFWRNRPHLPRPPNVLVLGIDSTSRNQFHRMLPVTTTILSKILFAFEMLGYSKVGINTFPNFVPLLSSYSVEELMKICMPSNLAMQDNCPYIWKNFSSQNYVTAHIEDAPSIAIFNYLKTGFVDQPTDIYPRPWMISVFDNADCIDSMSSGQLVIRYLEDLITLSSSHNVPFFITSWITTDTHGSMVGARNLDIPLSATLMKLHEQGLLNNSVLFLMGDHGYRWGEWRQTLAGWYEDKLPAMWIVLPSSLRRTFPMWADNLRNNSRQLSTPFDVYATLSHILFGNRSTERTFKPETRGVSLFEKLPSRSCTEAGVPIGFCACTIMHTETNISAHVIRLAVDSILRKINGMLPSSNCSVLRLDSVAGFADIGSNDISNNGSLGGSRKFVIGIVTAPGKINAEAIVGFNADSYEFEIIELMQTSISALNDNTHCLSENVSQEWCVCKVKKKIIIDKWWHN